MTIDQIDPSAVTALAREARRARRSYRLARGRMPKPRSSFYRHGEFHEVRPARSLPPDRDEEPEERPHR